MKILVAEDNSVSRLVLSSALQKLGHEVVLVSGGKEAWEALQREHYPILICAWQMPEFDGLQLCRMVRNAQRRYTYIILVTAKSGKANHLEAMEAGVDDFIPKPFDRELLAARLRVAERILALLSQVKALTGLLPICSYCKKVRDDHDYWQQVEEYVQDRSEAQFSHGICPECFEEQVKPQLAALASQSGP
jgi:sigma-B regulation protein RsbU (phosphoserine phosphatase)